MPRAPSSKGSAESDGLRPGGRPPTRRGSEDITDSIQHLRPARPQNLSCQRAEPPRRRRQSDIDDAEYLPSAATKPRQLAEAEPAVPGKSRAYAAVNPAWPLTAAGGRTMSPRPIGSPAELSGRAGAAAARDPSALRDWIGRPRSSARPSDSRSEGPTSPDTPRETCCTASAGGA
jgi:hypothetical protein